MNDLINTKLQSPQRSLMAFCMAHAHLNALIDEALQSAPKDQQVLRQLKKRRQALKALMPGESA